MMPATQPRGSARERTRPRAAGVPIRRGMASGVVALGVAALLAPASVAAQEGTVTYTHIVKREMPPGVQRGGPPGGRQQFTPPPRTTTLVLHFGPAGSLMTRENPRGARGAGGGAAAADRAAAAERFRRAGGDGDFDRRRATDGGGRGGFGLFGGGPGGPGGAMPDPYEATDLQAAYVDEAGMMVEARRFLGRTFRVTRERPPLEWRMTAEQAEHLGYTVVKAVAEQDSANIEAWFTPEIQHFGGPAPYGGLPGMILVLSVNDGQVQYQATEVALGELDEGRIAPPEEGDEVSQEEFERLVKERLEEMMRMRRRPGGDARR